MAKRNINYDMFARITAPENVDPNDIIRVIHNACSSRGWDFSANIEEEMDSDIPSLEDLLEEVD